jgi:hypothetical protein
MQGGLVADIAALVRQHLVEARDMLGSIIATIDAPAGEPVQSCGRGRCRMKMRGSASLGARPAARKFLHGVAESARGGAQVIKSTVKTAPPFMRQKWAVRYFWPILDNAEDCSAAEVAEMYGLPVNVVRRILRHALRHQEP